ncbi:MSF1-domain-containing protein [Moesziomyces antarcticus]|uniref:MSF1-domain-containing protein n=1 Tax=Pseudozyma antarctica TaxID=84753 RepID=UPI0007196124|nr:MSF1-domain-containing protein [Moesziomyces antarcticus]GAK63818.1 MSF1-domain-containing protein [Moesziomyces antarcticus]
MVSPAPLVDTIALNQADLLLPPLAVWNKYPNPHAEHVVSVDVIDQSIDRESGQLRTERIIGVRQGAPGWAKRLIGASEDTYVREVVMVNPFTKAVQMTSTNLSLSQYMLVKEYITYTPHIATNQQLPVTLFNQVADISCTGLTGILAGAARKVEEWSYTRFRDNAAKGRSGLISVLEAMYGSPSSTR